MFASMSGRIDTMKEDIAKLKKEVEQLKAEKKKRDTEQRYKEEHDERGHRANDWTDLLSSND